MKKIISIALLLFSASIIFGMENVCISSIDKSQDSIAIICDDNVTLPISNKLLTYLENFKFLFIKSDFQPEFQLEEIKANKIEFQSISSNIVEKIFSCIEAVDTVIAQQHNSITKIVNARQVPSKIDPITISSSWSEQVSLNVVDLVSKVDADVQSCSIALQATSQVISDFTIENSIYINNIFIAKNVLNLLQPILTQYTEAELIELVLATNFLGIPWLTNAIMSALVNKNTASLNNELDEKSIGDNIVEYFRASLNNELLPFIEKNHHLQRLGVDEFSLGDFVALYGMPQLTDEGKLLLKSKKLTSLNGAELPTQVKFLNLSCNYLSKIPEHFLKNVPDLEELYLYQNRLTTLIPENFSSLSKLKRIYLSFNLLNTVCEDLFIHNPNLDFLSLYSNYIQSLPEKLFDSNPNIRTINFSKNNIITIPEKLFAKLEKLQILELSKNQISALMPIHIQNNPLEFLSLQSNNLKNIELDKFNSIKTIFLHNNKFDPQIMSKLYSMMINGTQFIKLR